MGAQAGLARHIESTLTEAKELNDGAPTTLGGVVTALNRRYTKRGDLMATFVLEDLEAAMEVFVFPRTMADYGHLLEEDSVVAVKGRIDRRDDQAKFIAMEVRRPELIIGEGPPLRLKVPASRLTETLVNEIKRILEGHPGDSSVMLHLEDGRRTTVLRLCPGFGGEGGKALHATLGALARRLLRGAALPLPDGDVDVAGRIAHPGLGQLVGGLQEPWPRPGYRASGEDRAWGRRLAKRFGCDDRYDDRAFRSEDNGA